MEYIFIVLGAGSVCLNFSQFFSICLDHVEICMEYNFVELGAGSVCLNFSQLSSWHYVISSVPKAAMARTGSAYERPYEQVGVQWEWGWWVVCVVDMGS